MAESTPVAAQFAWLARICWFLKSWEEFSHDWLESLFSSIDRLAVFVLTAGFATRASKRESPEEKILFCLAVVGMEVLRDGKNGKGWQNGKVGEDGGFAL